MTKLFRILIIVFLFFNYTKNVFSAEKVTIKVKINKEIIKNFDLEKEKNYLIALNPNLKELKKNLQNKIAKDSIIKEIIKKNEIEKYFKFDQRNEMINVFIKTFIQILVLKMNYHLKVILVNIIGHLMKLKD